ncbi:hypothetical protein FPV67DRAFT_699855 [Lyophyllum atratum]|nr:hypothetical protein FPV67DRAFT_699855 [Lyophyllum atratum]
MDETKRSARASTNQLFSSLVGQTYCDHLILIIISEPLPPLGKEAPQSHARARKYALSIRDGYRCVVTGRYDKRSVKVVRELKHLDSLLLVHFRPQSALGSLSRLDRRWDSSRGNIAGLPLFAHSV